jgi:hypothetical protein
MRNGLSRCRESVVVQEALDKQAEEVAERQRREQEFEQATLQ